MRELAGTISRRMKYAHRPFMESLEARDCPASFSIISATVGTDAVSVKFIDDAGTTTNEVLPFNATTAVRVASGDFDGDGIVDDFAVIGRPSAEDRRAEIVVYTIDVDGGRATETDRFFAFDEGILGNGFIAVGDFDGDGDDDIAATVIGGDASVVTLQVHDSQGDGTFQLGASTPIGFGRVSAPRVAAGDVDNDGFDEILVVARTSGGANVRVFNADTGNFVQIGNFSWTFGIPGYARGAFIAVGEYDATHDGLEIVLGANVGGAGRVDIINFDAASNVATLSTNGRFQPFGAGYDAAVRVAAGDNFILSGQDRFQDGQAARSARDFDDSTAEQDPTPAIVTLATFAAILDSDGISPTSSPSGDASLGVFVAAANTTTVIAGPGGLEALDGNNSNAAVGGNTIAADEFFQFAFDGSNLALPDGAAFNDILNQLQLNVNLSGGSLGSFDLLLSVYSNLTGAPSQSIQLINDNLNPLTQQLTVTFADVATLGIDTGMPNSDGRLTGSYTSTAGNLNGFFTGGAVTSLNNFWVLGIRNNSADTITLIDWDLMFFINTP